MVEQREGQRRGRLRSSVRPTDEDHRATPFELFFDLVYVFAVTRITAYMLADHSASGFLRGLLILALLWGTWSGYTWLGNHSRADEGLVRAGMIVAMGAMFIVALTIPEAWRGVSGGLTGPLVLVCAYLLVRYMHLALYAVAATDDPALRRQIVISLGPVTAGAAVLVAGTLLGGWRQTVLFAVAVVVDWVGLYLTARRGNWRLRSPAHLTERHGLFIILAIGESVVAIGVGAAGQPIGAPLLFAATLGIAAAVCLWWLYFDTTALAAEHRLVEYHGQARVNLAVEAYTYGHFPIVAGIVLAALGVEGVLARTGEGKPLGVFYALTLYGGFALYLIGHVLFHRRMHGTLSLPRLLTAGVFLAAIPAAAVLPPLAGLAGSVAILTAVIVFESGRDAETRRRLRRT